MTSSARASRSSADAPSAGGVPAPSASARIPAAAVTNHSKHCRHRQITHPARACRSRRPRRTPQPPPQELRRLTTELECAAVATAVPTPHVNDVISACRDSGRSVAMVSNNSEKAVRAYLATHDLDSQIDMIAARRSWDPAILKPSPHLIDQAVNKLHTSASACVVVGDSTTTILYTVQTLHERRCSRARGYVELARSRSAHTTTEQGQNGYRRLIDQFCSFNSARPLPN